MAIVPRRIWQKMAPEDQALHQPDDSAEMLLRAPNFRGQEVLQQRIVNNWLNLRKGERRLWPINPRSDKATTIRRGHPDYSIWLPGGQVLLMEMKVPGGTFSDEQCEAIGLLSELGHKVEIPQSAYEAIKLVEGLL